MSTRCTHLPMRSHSARVLSVTSVGTGRSRAVLSQVAVGRGLAAGLVSSRRPCASRSRRPATFQVLAAAVFIIVRTVAPAWRNRARSSIIVNPPVMECAMYGASLESPAS